VPFSLGAGDVAHEKVNCQLKSAVFAGIGNGTGGLLRNAKPL
jgi:hypothetical protein